MIYYLLDTQRRLLKIGCSHNPATRLKVLQSRHEHTLLLAVEPGSFKRERAQHTTFAALRISGEWFRYDGSLKAYVEDLALRRIGRDEIEVRPRWPSIDVALLPATTGMATIGRHLFGWVDEDAARLIYCGAIPVRLTVKRDGPQNQWCWNCRKIIVVPKDSLDNVGL